MQARYFGKYESGIRKMNENFRQQTFTSRHPTSLLTEGLLTSEKQQDVRTGGLRGHGPKLLANYEKLPF